MARVALLSNPRSTGNQSLLPQIRAFCAEHQDIFHYEVEHGDQIGQALKTIARVKPSVLVINGGDGTVQATLTELHHGGHFADAVPPVAVLPNGKTNLIAMDLGAEGDPLEALKRVLDIARSDLVGHVVSRELISLRHGDGERPVLGMFLGGAGLADTMLYCRHKIYPLGLPNSVSHALTAIAAVISIILNIRARFLPPRPEPMRISALSGGEINGKFALLMVTTLEKLLIAGNMPTPSGKLGALRMMVIERRSSTMIAVFISWLRGNLGRQPVHGLHMQQSDEIMIEGDHSQVILDGEMFEANVDRPIFLRTSSPVPFLRLAA